MRKEQDFENERKAWEESKDEADERSCNLGWAYDNQKQKCLIVCPDYYYRSNDGTQCLQKNCAHYKYTVHISGMYCEKKTCDEGYFLDTDGECKENEILES